MEHDRAAMLEEVLGCRGFEVGADGGAAWS